MDIADTVGAAILAGGRSTRMGTNKALLRMQPGGPTLIELVVTRLRAAGFQTTLLVTNTPQEYAFLGVPSVPDDVPDAGPLGGILTALVHSPHARTLIVACDMPLLNPRLLRYMAILPSNSDAVVPRRRDDSGLYKVEPLHAIYAQSCIEPARAQVAAGRLRVMDLLGAIAVRWVEEAEIRRYDPDLFSFRNANTPEEWGDIASRKLES